MVLNIALALWALKPWAFNVVHVVVALGFYFIISSIVSLAVQDKQRVWITQLDGQTNIQISQVFVSLSTLEDGLYGGTFTVGRITSSLSTAVSCGKGSEM